MDFREIYDNHYLPVKRFISGMVGDAWAAEDLTQDAFIKIKENLDGLKDDVKLRPWIFRIARNLCLDHFRRQATKKEKSQEGPRGKGEAVEPVAQAGLERHEMSTCVQDKIQLLPEALRSALVLSDTMELRHQEIADILEIKVGNVKVRLHRARKALKEILECNCTFEHDERNVMVCLPKPITHIQQKPVQ
ncbi:MAG: RNA polymerase sigma factor [Deltaproteobacteria bacterium]|nr:RNA polymerase sigma factor [Deltaproteobacteria bacterium]